MPCIYDEPNEPYICEADWSCKDCPNWVEDKEVEDKEVEDGNDRKET